MLKEGTEIEKHGRISGQQAAGAHESLVRPVSIVVYFFQPSSAGWVQVQRSLHIGFILGWGSARQVQWRGRRARELRVSAKGQMEGWT